MSSIRLPEREARSEHLQVLIGTTRQQGCIAVSVVEPHSSAQRQNSIQALVGRAFRMESRQVRLPPIGTLVMEWSVLRSTVLAVRLIWAMSLTTDQLLQVRGTA